MPIMPTPRAVSMSGNPTLATILVAELDDALRIHLTGALRKEGYIVLEARDDGEALERVKIHSRHIHVLLIGADPNSRILASRLKPYRPGMEIIFVSGETEGMADDVLPPDLALDRIHRSIHSSTPTGANRASAAAF